ncbi:HK97-gp10 family putative phage morphogenesis protein [Priestia koreensis]|uniref:HK97-gp10 family putative phage morphogenesis protein n=1 Tax=Priestia koreensis TaxID=284581 RepID=UPI003D056E2F
MTANFDLSGMNELIARLNSMGREDGEQIEEKALKAGAKVVRDAIEEATPVSALPKNHAKDHIVISEVTDGKVSIGGGKDQFYLQFVEFGTSKQTAQPFMSTAFNRTKDEAKKEMSRVIRNELNL